MPFRLVFLRQISHGGVSLEAFLIIFSEKLSGSESYAAGTTGDQHDLGSHVLQRCQLYANEQELTESQAVQAQGERLRLSCEMCTLLYEW